MSDVELPVPPPPVEQVDVSLSQKQLVTDPELLYMNPFLYEALPDTDPEL